MLGTGPDSLPNTLPPVDADIGVIYRQPLPESVFFMDDSVKMTARCLLKEQNWLKWPIFWWCRPDIPLLYAIRQS
ncbi:MAG: hypothetical protein R2860_09100 [Desulfobacterales bacterium]